MSKLINAPSSRARRRSGRSLVLRWAIASAGAAGLICEYRAEILPDRLTTGKTPAFATNTFAQNVAGEADFWGPPLAQLRDDVTRISSGNKLASHFGNIPP